MLRCINLVSLKLTNYLPPPSMRSLELLSYPAYYMSPLHGVASAASPQPRIVPALTVSSLELITVNVGYVPADCQTFNSLVNTSEDRLLSPVIRNSYHVLRPLDLPPYPH